MTQKRWKLVETLNFHNTEFLVMRKTLLMIQCKYFSWCFQSRFYNLGYRGVRRADVKFSLHWYLISTTIPAEEGGCTFVQTCTNTHLHRWAHVFKHDAHILIYLPIMWTLFIKMLVHTCPDDKEVFLKMNHFNNDNKWLPKCTKIFWSGRFINWLGNRPRV